MVQVGLYDCSHAGVMEIVMNYFYPQEGDMHNVSVVKCSVHLNPRVSLECIYKWAYKSPDQLVRHKYDLSYPNST